MIEISEKDIQSTMQELSDSYHTKIRVIVDENNKYCVWIDHIDRIKRKKYLSNLIGRGDTYIDACIDYLINLLDTSYHLRYMKDFYATTTLRNIIKRNKPLMKYLKEIEGEKGV
jgi:hypothetical protein